MIFSWFNLIDISNSTSNIDISECDSYEWNGQTYTESGTYTYVNDNSYSIAFDGDNEYVNCGNGIDISNKSFTLSAWVKKDGADFTGASIVMSTGDGTINNGLYFDTGLIIKMDKIIYFLNFWGNGICYSTLPVNIEGDGEWHHIAATYNLLTNERILYLDGIIVGSDISQSAFMSSNTDFCIGITSWNLVDDFNGKIDDPCVWDRVLTQSEIQNYMNCPPTENESGLVGYWNFEEGEGETVIDLSGNGNDGTINEEAYSSDISEQSCQLTTVNGCDSVAVLNLTITEPDIFFYKCCSLRIFKLLNGMVKLIQRVVSILIHTQMLADAIVHISLNLTINYTTYGTDTQEHCDTFTWIDGNTYTESNNTAIFTLTNSNNYNNGNHLGIVTLDLIINNSDIGESGSITACDEFSWNGQIYTESGQYTNTYTNVSGCDSTHTLNLTINYTTYGTDTQEHCDTFTWIDGNTYTESNNTAIFTFTI